MTKTLPTAEKRDPSSANERWEMAVTRCREWGVRAWAHLEMFLFGAAMSWVKVPYVQKRRYELDRLFAVIVGSEMLGLPCLPAGSDLKLLPYFVPSLLYWKRLTIFSHELEGADLRHIGH